MTKDEFTHAQLGGMYRQLTAQHLTVHELRVALSQKGEFRTMGQVHDDLKLYGYADYAATHGQPRPPAAAEQQQQAEPAAEAEPTRCLDPKPSEPYQRGLGGLASAILRAHRDSQQ